MHGVVPLLTRGGVILTPQFLLCRSQWVTSTWDRGQGPGKDLFLDWGGAGAELTRKKKKGLPSPTRLTQRVLWGGGGGGGGGGGVLGGRVSTRFRLQGSQGPDRGGYIFFPRWEVGFRWWGMGKGTPWFYVSGAGMSTQFQLHLSIQISSYITRICLTCIFFLHIVKGK